MQLSERPCLHCLRPLSSICFDRRGKVYTKCYGCGARMFAASGECLRGLALLSGFAAKLTEQMQSEPAYGRKKAAEFEAFMAALRAQLAPPPVVTASEVAAAVAPEKVA